MWLNFPDWGGNVLPGAVHSASPHTSPAEVLHPTLTGSPGLHAPKLSSSQNLASALHSPLTFKVQLMPTGQVYPPVCSIPITETPPYVNKALYNRLSASWNILSCDPSETLLSLLMGHIRDMLWALLYTWTDKLRDVNWSFWGHTASKWYSWHLIHVRLFVYFKSSVLSFTDIYRNRQTGTVRVD